MPCLVSYDPSTRTLRSRVHGVLTLDEVRAWRDALYRATAEMEAGSAFRALVDIREYSVDAQARDAHQAQREVIPVFLAHHGLAVGFWGLYQATPPEPTDGPYCLAVAHVHHEQAKMDRYNELLASARERFFSDVGEAEAWLARSPASDAGNPGSPSAQAPA